MVEFVQVFDVFGQMMVAHAIASLGDNAPQLSEKDRAEIQEYLKADQKYRAALSALEKKKRANKAIKASMSSRPLNDITAPAKPPCPRAAKDLLTAIAVYDGDDLSKSARAVEEHITSGRIKSFAMDKGVPYRIKQGGYYICSRYENGVKVPGLYWPGHTPWFYGQGEGPYRPIAILKDDYEYFMQHGEPMGDATPAPQPPLHCCRRPGRARARRRRASAAPRAWSSAERARCHTAA